MATIVACGPRSAPWTAICGTGPTSTGTREKTASAATKERSRAAWGTAAGAFVGTLALTTALRTASELRLTRMDVPFLLGTAVTVNRTRAKAIGYLMHFLNGQVFAFVYLAVFVAIDQSGWWLGALFGRAHGLFAGTALVNILLPLVHPRIGSPLTSAPQVALLEPPGFLMRNYGPGTPVVTVLAHIGYGATVGGFTNLAA